MESKEVKCTFYGLRSQYDSDLRDRMREAIQGVVEENDSIEFLVFTQATTHQLFMLEVGKLKAKYPDKSIRILKVIDPEDYPEGVEKLRSFYESIGSLNNIPDTTFDGITFASEYTGKADKESPSYMMLRVHSIQRWIFSQCDLIFTYDYLAFADTESHEIAKLSRNKKKTVISLASEKTEKRIMELAQGLDEKQRDILNRVWAGASYAQIGIKYGVSGTAIKHAANRASREIRETLRRENLRAFQEKM